MNDMIFSSVWKTFPKCGAPLVLMLAITEAAGENGLAELSMSQLATTTRMSRSTVWQLLDRLAHQGWMDVLKSRVDMTASDHHQCLPIPVMMHATPKLRVTIPHGAKKGGFKVFEGRLDGIMTACADLLVVYAK